MLRFYTRPGNCCTTHRCIELILSMTRKSELYPAQNSKACIEHSELRPPAFTRGCNTTKYLPQVVVAISPHTLQYPHPRMLASPRLAFSLYVPRTRISVFTTYPKAPSNSAESMLSSPKMITRSSWHLIDCMCLLPILLPSIALARMPDQ